MGNYYLPTDQSNSDGEEEAEFDDAPENKMENKNDEPFVSSFNESQFWVSLTTRHLAARRKRAAEYRDWMQSDWRQVLFANKLRFILECETRRVLVWYDTKKVFGWFLRGRIFRRLECGRTQLEVSDKLGIAQSVIYRLWKRFEDYGNVSRCCSTGRPRVTTPNEDRYLAVTAKRNRRSSASDLSRHLSSVTGTTV
ncbi:transposable element Tcb2 transposase [Trichonephila clavipes]|nr:transposable element Tcb2 transposase [Trichonephila clavipes]